MTFGIAIILQNVLLETFSADFRGIDAGSIETDSIQVTDQLSIGWFPLLTFLVSIVAARRAPALHRAVRDWAGPCARPPTTCGPRS